MSELSDLYQDVILDHHKKPRNFGALPDATHRAVGHNPLCGDRITVAVRLQGDVIEEVRFEGSGCAISQASASMMTQALKGHDRREAAALKAAFQSMVTGHGVPEGRDLGKLEAFAGVAEFPMRVKCASLAWHTLQAALDGSQAASTEDAP